MSVIFAWWNLLFLIPLAVSTLFLLMKTLGLDGSANAHMETAAQSEVGRHEGATFDAGHDMDHDLDSDPDVDRESDPHPSAVTSSQVFLEFLGAGKIPFTLILQIFFLTWGISGWLLNQLLQPLAREPWIFIWVSIAGAFVSSSLITRYTAKLLWKYAPLSETYAKVREDLIGCEGEAVYKISHENGMAQVYDERGSLHRIYCRIKPQGALIPEGEKVLIVGYDSEEDLYLVKRNPLSAKGQVESLTGKGS